MKRIVAWTAAVLLLLGCVYAYAESAEDLEEVRCDGWHFSVRIPAGMKAVPYDYEDEEYEKVTGGGLAVCADEEGGMPQVWIIRRGHDFVNPSFYFTDFYWQYLPDNSDGIDDEPGIGIYRYGGITLRGSGVRFIGDDDEELYREYRFIPYRNDRGTEFLLRYTVETEQEAYALLDTVIRNYLPDEEPEKTEAKYKPVPQDADPANGTFPVSFEDVDRIATDGYFTAVLYTMDVYSEEDVFSIMPGDTLQINGRVFTVSNVDERDPGYDVGFDTVEDTRDQSFWGFTFEEAVSGNGYNIYIMNDWHSLSRIASVRVDASALVAYYDVPGGDDPELMDEDLLGSEAGINALAWLTPYNTTCTMKDGKLVRIDSSSYPVGPVDPFIPADREALE